jgi:hypothetical protein
VHAKNVRFSGADWDISPDGPTAGEPSLSRLRADVALPGGGHVEVELARRDGQLVVHEARFRADDGDGLGQRAFRDFRITDIQEAAEEWERSAKEFLPVPDEFELGPVDYGSPNPGRRPQTDRGWLAHVASVYVEEVGRGPKPRQRTAERLGYSDSGTADLLRKARKVGILSPATTGRAGGELTEDGKRWLDDWKRRPPASP